MLQILFLVNILLISVQNALQTSTNLHSRVSFTEGMDKVCEETGVEKACKYLKTLIKEQGCIQSSSNTIGNFDENLDIPSKQDNCCGSDLSLEPNHAHKVEPTNSSNVSVLQVSSTSFY